jgi:hypothetical protein
VSSVPDLLAGWELGLSASDSGRTVLLHSLARPGETTGRLLAMPVGERDADLLDLRRRLFGDAVALRAACERCGADLEFAFDLGAVPAAATTDAQRRVTSGEWSVLVRQPTGGDLLAVAGTAPQAARRALLDACVLEATHRGRRSSAGRLPASVRRLVGEACAAVDPRADITLSIACAVCDRETKAVLDIGAVLWTELDVWARGLLLDVHLLACAYGWTEADVFALSPVRRRYYLELAGHD